MAPLINRKFEKEKIAGYFQELSDKCDEIVDLGSTIYDLTTEVKKQGDNDIPPVLLFRQAVEILDSISIQIRQSSIEPCKILLRSFFELLLSIEYLLEKDQLRRRKCYLLYHYLSQLKNYKKFLPRTQSGREFRNELEKDKFIREEFFLDLSKFESIFDSKVSNLQELLKKEKFKKIEEEYRLLRKEKRKFSWYSFYGGPRTLEQLAQYLGMISLYKILYKNWSMYAHGEDPISGNFRQDENEEPYIIQLRSGINAPTIARFFYIFSFRLYKKMTSELLPTKQKMIIDKLARINNSLEHFLRNTNLKEER